ncbi:hypothetical protein CH373_13465 [Leptospira perolatii]|uniref:Lipoprotein n=1 Tax=Leptospira perolatii TaxID=2023191 RepID=A0A2M9ZKV9_9LEPT|nr:hypothetical protein [Leptospira perolatii]PJZ69886.1 hypothetical protein CH360_08220 [Leptospira perolatii]PJZ72706.1 hypothetical protein CH373_13465 [Leptospira perolatii]
MHQIKFPKKNLTLVQRIGFLFSLGILLSSILGCGPSTDKTPYKELREIAFRTKPEDVGVSIKEDITSVYGIIMDWPTSGEIATLVTFLSGDASLYLSSGPSFIGGGGRDSIHASSVRFIRKYAYLWKEGKKISGIPKPDGSKLRFYFLTTQGIYYQEDSVTKVDKDDSVLVPIFDEAQAVISEIRLETDKEKDD